MKKISVIIPVYNTEAYLERCIGSVTSQTYENIEIICVDDASEDNSLDILYAFSSGDQRIKVISSTKNHGVSCARNSGIEAATGDYIYFIDSDDWIDQSYLEHLITYALLFNTDIVMNSNVINEYSNGESEKFYFPPFAKSIGYETNAIVSVKENLDNFPLLGWTILYSKHLIDAVTARFPDGIIMGEMTYFLMTTIVHCKKIGIINTQSYHYYHHIDSARGKVDVHSSIDIIKIWELIYENYKIKNILYTNKLPCFRQILWYFMYADISMRKKAFIELTSFFREIHSDIFKNKKLYTDIELKFFDTILTSKSYTEFKKRINLILASFIRSSHWKQLDTF